MKDTNQDSKRIVQAIGDELKKVTWPTRRKATELTITVLTICLIIGAYVGIIDFLLAKALEVITKLG